MKSFIIFVLLVALGAAAFFTRPSQDDFKRFVVQHQTQNDKNVITRTIDQTMAEHFADSCTFQDRYLWVNVQKDGKTAFTGAFAHWFSHEAVKNELNNLDQQVKQASGKISKI